MGFACQQRFETGLIGDEDNVVVLDHLLMNQLITLSPMPEVEANRSKFSGHNSALKDMPVVLTKSLYQYCVSQPEIKDCHLAIANMGIESWTLLMRLDCINDAERSKHIEEIIHFYWR